MSAEKSKRNKLKSACRKATSGF